MNNSNGANKQKLAKVLNAEKNAISGITGTPCVFGEFPPASSAPWICPAMALNPQEHTAGCAQPNQGLSAFIQVFPADPLQFNTSIRANQRFSKPPCFSAGTYFFLFLFLRIMTHAQCFQVKAPHSLCSLGSSTQRFLLQNPRPRWSRTHPREGRKGGARCMHCPAPREHPPCRQVPAQGRRCWGWEGTGRSCWEPGLDLTLDPSWRCSIGNAQH